MSKLQISKKKLLSLLNENLEEMAMDFTTADRPERGLQSKLAAGATPHQKVPYPETGRPNQNFQELLASERYQQVVDKLKEYVPDAPTLSASGPQNLMPLMTKMMNAYNQISQIERNSRRELEQLAINLVKKEMGLPEGSVQFDARIVGMEEIDTEDFNREGNEQPPQGDENQGGEEGEESFGDQNNVISDEDVEIEADLFQNLESLDIEKAKRRVINSIIQGASKRGHYMYHYVSEEIRRITGSDRLIGLYGILMSINDTLYWQFTDENMKAAMGGGGGGGGSVGGKEQVRLETEPPTIFARALNFPILVHELIKGVMELIGTRGSSKEYEDVEAEEDTMENEIWDLRLGPAIWDRLRAQFPEEILIDENQAELQNYLLSEIFELPAKKFLVFFKEVISKSDRGIQLMNRLMENVYRIFNQEDYEIQDEEFDLDLDEATKQVNDEDLMNFLTSLGIKLDRNDRFGPNATEYDPEQMNE